MIGNPSATAAEETGPASKNAAAAVGPATWKAASDGRKAE